MQVTLAESRTLAFYHQGRAMLASRDFDDMSIAQLAKAAGCSVGAFYVRFADKTVYLDFVIVHTLQQARHQLADALPAIVVDDRPGAALADHLISMFSDPEFAGVARAAIKLGFADARHRRPFDAYRETVAQQFVEMTQGEDERAGDPQRVAILQVGLGMLTDAITCSGPDALPDWPAIRPSLVGLLDQSKPGSPDAINSNSERHAKITGAGPKKI